nr:disease resistance protein TAO1-like [Ipomoea batatas]GME02446.1 disease resistance protein TAO1-like [Ipomoea batatas]
MQARFQNPNPQWFIVRASKDMVQEYLRNVEAAGSSPHCSLPLFFTKKRIFVLVMISCCFDCPCFLKYKITDKHSKFEDEAFCLGNNADTGCEFRLLYDHFTEPNKIEELEVVVEIDSLEEGVEDNLSIETCCIVHEEEGDELALHNLSLELEFRDDGDIENGECRFKIREPVT